jgi:hypothetical protein
MSRLSSQSNSPHRPVAPPNANHLPLAETRLSATRWPLGPRRANFMTREGTRAACTASSCPYILPLYNDRRRGPGLGIPIISKPGDIRKLSAKTGIWFAASSSRLGCWRQMGLCADGRRSSWTMAVSPEPLDVPTNGMQVRTSPEARSAWRDRCAFLAAVYDDSRDRHSYSTGKSNPALVSLTRQDSRIHSSVQGPSFALTAYITSTTLLKADRHSQTGRLARNRTFICQPTRRSARVQRQNVTTSYGK